MTANLYVLLLRIKMGFCIKSVFQEMGIFPTYSIHTHNIDFKGLIQTPHNIYLQRLAYYCFHYPGMWLV